MFKKLLSVFILFSAIAYTATAQNAVVDYLYNRSIEPYKELEDDTTLGSGFQDDILYMGKTNSSGIGCISCSLTGEGFPIGFDFVYNGETFARWGFSSNGYIKLGNGTFTIKNTLSSAFSSTGDSSLQSNIIAGLHADIMMTVIQGSFRYRTIGNPGARILVVEYRGMKHYTSSVTSEEIYNFQIRLHEGSNKISFAYGTFLKDAVARTYAVGLRGRFFNNMHLRALPSTAASWNDNTRGYAANSTMAMNLNLLPTDGLVFNFLPRSYDNDLSIIELTKPIAGEKPCPMSTTEGVSITIKNTGVLPQSSAKIGFTTSNGQVVNQPVTFTPMLEANQTRNFDITTPANLSGLIPPVLKAFVFLPGEEEGSRNNDTIEARFFVGRPLETNTISSYDSLILRGWKPGRGANAPMPGFSLWKLATDFGVNNSALVMPKDTPLVKNEWLYSPSYVVDTLFTNAISFQAAITEGLTGTGAIASIGDDTIKLMYSTDCRVTWKPMKTFNSADLTAGTISNQLKPFQAVIPPSARGLITFAFFGKNNGNTFTSDYRFLFRSFRINKVPRFDLSADTVRIPSIVSLTCKYSSQEPLTIKVTNRGFEAIDSTEAGFYLNSGNTIRRKFAFTPVLQPGASAWLTFSGTSGADVSVTEGQGITSFVYLKRETSATKFNDTARYSYNLIAGLSIPTPVYQSYAEASTARWQRGRGKQAPGGAFSLWGAKATIPGQATIGMDFSTNPGALQEWYYSASYTGPSIVKFTFKAAVTEIGGPGAATGMNGDSVKVRYSVDCGATWNTIKAFAASDLSSGVINANLKEFNYDLVSTRGSILVGFAGYRTATGATTNGFTFHVDSISIVSPSFPDFSSTGLLTGLNGSVTCPGTTPVALGVIVRNSGSVPVTSATVGYTLNNVPFSKIVNYSGTGLAAGKVDTVRFLGTEAPVYASAGSYKLKGFVVLSTEAPSTAFNDTSALYTFSLFPKVDLPYVELFPQAGFLPTGWVSDTLSGKGFKISAGRGLNGAQALSFRAQPTANRANFVTRNFGVVSSTANFLSIAYRSQEQSGAFFRLRPSDFIDFFISTNCGTTYTHLGRIDSTNQYVGPGFIPLDLSLEAYMGMDITVKVEAKLTPKSFSSNYLDISRFSIAGPTAVDDWMTAGDQMTLFPNPCKQNQMLHLTGIRGGVQAIRIISTDGKSMNLPWENDDVAAHIRIQTQSLAKGLYMIQVVTQSAVKTAKVLID